MKTTKTKTADSIAQVKGAPEVSIIAADKPAITIANQKLIELTESKNRLLASLSRWSGFARALPLPFYDRINRIDPAQGSSIEELQAVAEQLRQLKNDLPGYLLLCSGGLKVAALENLRSLLTTIELQCSAWINDYTQVAIHASATDG